MVEDLIRTWYGNRQTSKQKPSPRIDNSPDPSGNGHADSVHHAKISERVEGSRERGQVKLTESNEPE